MRRILAASFVLAFLMSTEAVQAQSLERQARHLRTIVVARFGKREPGRDILKYGIPTRHGTRKASPSEIAHYVQVLGRMLAPAAASSAPARAGAVPPRTSVPTIPRIGVAASVATTTTSTSTGGVPACASESGTNYSTGPDNTNPSSGATGRYQILPSTAASYGCSLATPAGQDRCAQAIYKAAGSSQWDGCGG